MIIKTDGVVIREQTTGERDRLVTLLTRKLGVIRAFVNGVRSPKSRNSASTGLLCYSDFVIEQKKSGVYTVAEATAKEVFFRCARTSFRFRLRSILPSLPMSLRSGRRLRTSF